MLSIKDLFSLEHTLAADYLEGFTWPWEALSGLGGEIKRLIGLLPQGEYEAYSDDVLIHRTARISPLATITGPCIIGPETEVRPGAFIRGKALVGAGCVVGNSVELKNCILFDSVQVPHYNYVGDSILGYHAHMGAGAVTSNIKADQKNVVVHDGTEAYNTGLRKMGAMLGDGADIGCNTVLNPGTIIGRYARVYPLSCVRGTVPEKHIYKTGGTIVPIK